MVTTAVDPDDAGRYGVVQVAAATVRDYAYKPDEPRGNLVSNEVFVFRAGRAARRARGARRAARTRARGPRPTSCCPAGRRGAGPRAPLRRLLARRRHDPGLLGLPSGAARRGAADRPRRPGWPVLTRAIANRASARMLRGRIDRGQPDRAGRDRGGDGRAERARAGRARGGRRGRARARCSCRAASCAPAQSSSARSSTMPSRSAPTRASAKRVARSQSSANAPRSRPAPRSQAARASQTSSKTRRCRSWRSWAGRLCRRAQTGGPRGPVATVSMSSPTHLRLASPNTRRRAPRVVVIGAGLGGLAARAAAAGRGARRRRARAARAPRRPRLPAARRRLHLGHRPVADHDAVGARGDVRRRRAGPALARSRCAGSTRSTGSTGRARSGTSTSAPTATRLRAADRAVLRRATPRSVDGFLAALRPIYEEGILGAGRRPFGVRARLRAARADDGAARRAACRCTASSRATSSTRGCARRSRSTRCSSAATRTACRRSTARSSTCRCSTAAGTPTAACTRSSRRWRGRSTCAAARRVERDRARRRPRDRRRLAGGERIAADVVVSNADVLRTHELLGRRAPRRRLRPTMSCFLLYLGTDRRFERAAAPHAARRATATASSSATSRAARGCRATFSTYVHAPARTEPAMAPPGGDSLASCCRCRTCAPGSTGSARRDRLRDALVADLEPTLRARRARRDRVVVEHRMTPLDFARELGAGGRQRVRGRADAAPVAPTSARPTATAAARALLRRRRDASRAPASPACCWAPRSPPGSSADADVPRRVDGA